MRVKVAIRGDLGVSLIAVSLMNKGVGAIYEGMRVGTSQTFHGN